MENNKKLRNIHIVTIIIGYYICFAKRISYKYMV